MHEHGPRQDRTSERQVGHAANQRLHVRYQRLQQQDLAVIVLEQNVGVHDAQVTVLATSSGMVWLSGLIGCNDDPARQQFRGSYARAALAAQPRRGDETDKGHPDNRLAA
jgi:hypothetical protein